jgi:hypothetical protein
MVVLREPKVVVGHPVILLDAETRHLLVDVLIC